MAETVLVSGGTGTLGRELVPRSEPVVDERLADRRREAALEALRAQLPSRPPPVHQALRRALASPPERVTLAEARLHAAQHHS